MADVRLGAHKELAFACVMGRR